MRVCITGANGFIGNNLARALLAEGYEVRAVVRPQSDITSLKGLDVEIYRGLLLDVNFLSRAFSGCKVVFHVAGNTSFKRSDWEEVYSTNVLGTSAVIKAVKNARVDRLVFTSSSAAIGASADPDNPADETYQYDGDRLGYLYYQSKHLAERKILYNVESGLDAVIVNPTVVIGANDYKKFSENFFWLAEKGLMRVAPPGGINIVDVEDAAQGHILAMKHGKTGQRYIISGTNMRFSYIFERINSTAGRNIKTTALPLGAMLFFGALNEFMGKTAKTEIPLTSEMGYTSEQYLYYTSNKAKRKLGYESRPFDETLRNTYSWYKNRDRVK